MCLAVNSCDSVRLTSKGHTKPLPPRFPVCDQEGNTTIVVQTYAMNGRVVFSNSYLDETPVEDVDVGHIAEVPDSGLAQLICYTASLEDM